MSGISRTVWKDCRKVSSRVVLHEEPISQIQSSTELNLAADPDFPRLSYANTDTTLEPHEVDAFGEQYNTCSCCWSMEAREVEVKRNGFECVWVGESMYMGAMRDVWATFIRTGGKNVACDAAHRAHMVFQVVVDRRFDPGHGDVLVHDMDNVDDIVSWQSAWSSRGSTKEKLAFVYDVLLGECHGDIEWDN